MHEEIYRGADAVARLGETRVTICGAGALGSQLADNLARQGFAKLRVIDHDRVEEHNVSTQIYGVADVGAKKVDVLRNRLFRSVGVEIDAAARELTERTVRTLLKNSDLVVDTFDNSVSRQLVQQHCRQEQLACLHVGLYADYCESVWDQVYRVPGDVAGDVCEYPLARNLVLLAVSIASETIIRHVLDGESRSRSATLRDFAVQDLEA
jgi:hypothetical protein